MGDAADAEKLEGVVRSIWGNLRISIRVDGSHRNERVALGCVLKTSGQQQSTSAPPVNRQPPPTFSAAASNPDVRVLKARLLGRKELVKKWSAAGEPLTDELLWRWLRSKHSLEQAEAGLLDHASWRINVGQISEVDIQSELAARKTYLQGCDRHGRPVIVVLAARHVIKQRNLDETKRLITYTLEHAIASSDTSKNALGQVLCLFDLSGLGFGNLDTKALQTVFEILQQHFPESLSELWFLNAPFIFWGIWKVVSPFIQPATKNKIKFLNGRKRTEMLMESISPKVLPSCYGGDADLLPIEVAVKRFNRSLSSKGSQHKDKLSQKEARSRLGDFMRNRRQTANRSWHFLKEHNPVWAARVFSRGIKRAGAALPRPNWRRGRPELRRHASAMSIHVRNAWRNRPPMPRPHYRLKARTVQSSAHMAYIDVAAFYILLVLFLVVVIPYLADQILTSSYGLHPTPSSREQWAVDLLSRLKSSRLL